MIKKICLSLSLILFAITANSQALIKAQDLVGRSNDRYGGSVSVEQDIRVDSLLSRHIDGNIEYKGIDGFRIQIYRGSSRNAREEANNAKAEFISDFPGIKSYLRFDQPNFFKVRVGDYRTKRDAYPDYLKIVKKFPNAYIVTDIINFPDLEK